MNPDNDDNRGYRHHPNHRSLEPHLAILQVEAHVGQVTNKVWLAGYILAEARSDRRVGRNDVRSRDSSKDDKEKIGNGVITTEPDKRGDVLDNSNEAHERRDGFGGEVTGKETPKEGETLTTPRIEGTLPLGLWLGALQRAPEGIELEGEEEVEDGAGEGDEESDRSSGAG